MALASDLVFSSFLQTFSPKETIAKHISFMLLPFLQAALVDLQPLLHSLESQNGIEELLSLSKVAFSITSRQ